MNRLARWFKDFYKPEVFNDLDVSSIADAFNDSGVRMIWLNDCFEEIQRINREVEKRLLSGSEMGIIDLCARRKAYQDVLEAVLSAKRLVIQASAVPQDSRHNPRVVDVNLDRVTV